MTTRRQFVRCCCAAALGAILPVSIPTVAASALPWRPIPGSSDSLPIVGLGNSKAFRVGDLETSTRIIGTLLEHGGAYIDCGGSNRFVVADVVGNIDAENAAFLGTYFSVEKEAASRREAKQLLSSSGKASLDLRRFLSKNISACLFFTSGFRVAPAVT